MLKNIADSFRRFMGPGGNCKCPNCGYFVPHIRGFPCDKIPCIICGSILIRG